jgi:hypothetical protein
MESWVEEAHVIDYSWPCLDFLVRNDSEKHKMLGEVLDVINRHLQSKRMNATALVRQTLLITTLVLHESTTTESDRDTDELPTWEHEDGASRDKHPRPSSAPLVDNTSLTTQKPKSRARVRRSTSERPSFSVITQSEIQDTTSLWSGLSGYSAKSALSNVSVVILLRPGAEQSKKMVERFIKRLFDVTNSVFLPHEREPTDKPKEEGLAEDSFSNFAYQQTLDTISRLVPMAKDYLRRRIARTSTRRLEELSEAKTQLRRTFNEPYFPGKYISEDPRAFDYIPRRAASIPADREGPSHPAWTSLRELRKHSTFPIYSPRYPVRKDTTDLLRGVGAAHSGNVIDRSTEPRCELCRTSGFADANPGRFDSGVSPIPQLHLYICFVESCPTPYDVHESAESWEKHLCQNHPEVMNNPTWMCTAWSHAPKYPHFCNELSFQHHMYEKHADSFDPDILPDLTDACYQSPKSVELCPFCGVDWDESFSWHTSESRAPEPSFLEHVLAHLDEIALKIFYSLPLYSQETDEVTDWQSESEQIRHAASEIRSNTWISDILGPLQPSEDCLQEI